MQQKPVKIGQPARVKRILQRVCNERLEVLVRREEDQKIAVRGIADGVRDDRDPGVFMITDISDKGLRHLARPGLVRVEFAGLSTKVLFRSKILKQDFDTLHVVRPTSLFSIERRQNSRHLSHSRMQAFIDLKDWTPTLADVTSPPIVEPYSSLANWVSLADISEGGFCAVTRFPALVDALERGHIDDEAKLILPMQAPIACPVEVRWLKRIKQRLNIDRSTREQRFFRVGLQFVDPSPELNQHVQQYIHQLSMVDAI